MTLYIELTNAGLPIISATETGEIVFQPGATLTAQQLATMNDVCMQYLRPAEYAAWAQIRDRLNNAKLTANTIPNWAMWTQDNLLDWWNANLSTTIINALSIPQAAKDVLNTQSAAILREGQMLIALRDQTWPDLPE